MKATGGIPVGGKPVAGRTAVRSFAVRGIAARVTAAALPVLLGTLGLAGCEYSDTDRSSVESTGSPSYANGPPGATPQAAEQAREQETIADVEAQLGEERETRLFSALGGMKKDGTLGMAGIVAAGDTYLVRAACSSGQGAELSVSQAGSSVLRLHVACGVPRETLVDLRSGPFSAALRELGSAERSVGAVRLEKAPAAAPEATPGAAG